MLAQLLFCIYVWGGNFRKINEVDIMFRLSHKSGDLYRLSFIQLYKASLNLSDDYFFWNLIKNSGNDFSLIPDDTVGSVPVKSFSIDLFCPSPNTLDSVEIGSVLDI